VRRAPPSAGRQTRARRTRTLLPSGARCARTHSHLVSDHRAPSPTPSIHYLFLQGLGACLPCPAGDFCS
jgi:hypothetical protein